MKNFFFILLLFGSTEFVNGQQHEKDSLTALLSKSKEDSLRVNLLYDLGNYYDEKSMPDSAIFWSTQALALAQKTGYKKGENDHKLSLSDNYWEIGDYATAIKLSYSVFEYGSSVNDTNIMVLAIFKLTNAYRDQGDYREALKYLLKNFGLMKNPDYEIGYAVISSNYYGLEKYDSANFFLRKARSFGEHDNNYGWILLMTARIFEKLNNENAALDYYRQSVGKLKEEKNLKDLAGAYNSLASLYGQRQQADSVIYFANKALILDEQNKFNKEKAETYLILSKIYEKINTGMAFGYYKLAISARDSLFNQEKQRQVSSFKFNQELNQAEFQNKLEQSQLKYRNRLNIYLLLGGLVILLIVAVGLSRRNIYRKKTIALLEKQKKEIQSTLTQLKSTQSQLIQSEKMASLGELTAGIAHEIQNPLNFVNNFSEVNNELISDMRELITKRNFDEVDQIAKDVQDNEQKINQHGKRADAIVKGMLQHSRLSTGVKEPTDINVLANEYLRISYHGFKAKDNAFSATMQIDFDNNIAKINIVPQDIGRVLLNLYNNALYAVSEKKKQQPHNYEPTVSVKTKKSGNYLLISVKDNGNGIPQKVVDKIFQPFFTTKPTGQGTGLGLSLSYDIVKAHGGEIKTETKEGEFTEFVIQLPINS